MRLACIYPPPLSCDHMEAHKKEATESLNQTLTELLTCLIYDILLR